jgi:uncharacterized protein (TIGR03067 family)
MIGRVRNQVSLYVLLSMEIAMRLFHSLGLSLGVLGICCLCGAARQDAKKDDAVKEELKRLEGKWEIVSIELGGKPVDRSKLGPTDHVVFSGKKMSIVTKALTLDTTVTLDLTKDPKWMDVISSDAIKMWPGIYELKGDTLKVAMAGESEGKRPTEFKTKEGGIDVVYVYQRAKK